MPDLNQTQPLLATYLIQNRIWWIEFANLSGICEDTYSYADKQFLTQWVDAILDEYPDFNVVGEEWSANPITVSYWQKVSRTQMAMAYVLTSNRVPQLFDGTEILMTIYNKNSHSTELDLTRFADLLESTLTGKNVITSEEMKLNEPLRLDSKGVTIIDIIR